MIAIVDHRPNCKFQISNSTVHIIILMFHIQGNISGQYPGQYDASAIWCRLNKSLRLLW